MAANPPDILLTNFMMLELLLTRQNDIDKAVMRNAKGCASWCWTSCTLTEVARAPMWRFAGAARARSLG
jgi:hypothetical protein